MIPILAWSIVCNMELIQIGEVIKQKTIMDMILEMAENQFSEIEQLKAAASSRKSRRPRRTTLRCSSSERRR